MYLNYFKMKKSPFNVTPDPEFLFLSPSHKEALAAVIYGVEQKKGFVAIIGEVGVGKTTIIRSYLNKADRERLKLIYLFNANISFTGLLKSVLREFGSDDSSQVPFEMVTRLHEHLISEYTKGRTVVLIIDEAQNMPVETLENLRMLSNLETTKDKLLQIVFSAQPEFEKLLARNELRQLKQRIAVKATILPLSSDESMSYIRHRLAKADVRVEAIFTTSAMRLIVRQAKGIPRVINMLCDNSLITSYGYKHKSVNRRTVREIAADAGIKRERTSHLGHYAAIALLVAVIIFTGTYIALNPVASQPETFTRLPPAATRGTLPTAPVATPSPPPGIVVAPVAELAEEPASVSRLVKKGDTLARLTLDTYGYADKTVLEFVHKNNPGIRDINRIEVGEKIIFPIARK